MTKTHMLLGAPFAALAAIAFAHAIAAGEPAGTTTDIDWQTSPLDLDLRGMNGERYAFRCPPGKPWPSLVTGSGPYTDDSSICTAAVHAGVLRAGSGGDVEIEIRPGLPAYAGSERNYIRSGDYGSAWSGSFIVLRPVDAASPPPGIGDSHVRP
jgi:LCCL domain